MPDVTDTFVDGTQNAIPDGIDINKTVSSTKIATFNGPVISKLTKDQTKETSILVCLSVKGNKHCLGTDLLTTLIQTITNHQRTYVLIGDLIQIFNVGTAEQALALGDKFLIKTMPVFLKVLKHFAEFNIEQFNFDHGMKPLSEQINAYNELASALNVSIQIYRWQEWIGNKGHGYASVKTETEALFESVNELRESLEKSTNEYVSRPGNRTSHESLTMQKKCTRDFFKEEIPGIIIPAARLGINFIAYPGRKVKLIQPTAAYFVTHHGEMENSSLRVQVANPEKLVNWVEISIEDNPEIVAMRALRQIGHFTRRGYLQPSATPVPKIENGDNSKDTETPGRTVVSPCEFVAQTIRFQLKLLPPEMGLKVLLGLINEHAHSTEVFYNEINNEEMKATSFDQDDSNQFNSHRNSI